jgi:hypothetical protein
VAINGIIETSVKMCDRNGFTRSQDSSVGTGWTVWGSNSVGEARFSAPVQTGSEAHPVFYTKGTGSFPRVKRPERGVDHPPHLAPRLKKE